MTASNTLPNDKAMCAYPGCGKPESDFQHHENRKAGPMHHFVPSEPSRFKVSFDANYRRMKRPKFEDVVRDVWEQLDDLGHDLTNSLLIAPRGCTPRQFTLALDEIDRQKNNSRRHR